MKPEILISTPARRYARALLEVALKQGTFTNVLEELGTFRDQLQNVPLLKVLFLNPAISNQKKLQILEGLCNKMKFQQLTINFLRTLIHRDRLNLLEQIVYSAEQQHLERQGILVVEVTTARKLEADQEQKLISKLESFTGKKIRLQNSIEPALIGGAVTRIGTTLYDGSVEAQLQHLKAKIQEA
jgi:F-type H+-transporting ATPase subunit delta